MSPIYTCSVLNSLRLIPTLTLSSGCRSGGLDLLLLLPLSHLGDSQMGTNVAKYSEQMLKIWSSVKNYHIFNKPLKYLHCLKVVSFHCILHALLERNKGTSKHYFILRICRFLLVTLHFQIKLSCSYLANILLHTCGNARGKGMLLCFI